MTGFKMLDYSVVTFNFVRVTSVFYRCNAVTLLGYKLHIGHPEPSTHKATPVMVPALSVAKQRIEGWIMRLT